MSIYEKNSRHANHIRFKRFIMCSIVLAFAVSYSSCDKATSNPGGSVSLDPPAGNYYSTIFCKIGNVDWCDCSVGGGLPNWKYSGVIATYYDKDAGTPMVIEAKNICLSDFSDIYIYIDAFEGIGKYALTKKGSGSYAGYACNLSGVHTKLFATDFNRNGVIEITEFDATRKLLSGTFSFDAFYVDSNQVINVNSGTLMKVKYN